MVIIFLFFGVQALVKWVDDFVFFRYPIGRSPNGDWIYSYTEELIWSIAKELGWPWSLEKFVPFSYSFTYIGFDWSLENKTVSLPDKKRTKYLNKLLPFRDIGYLTTREQLESLIGTLNHVTLILPNGRAHLPSLFKLRATFPSNSRPWTTRKITAAVAEDIKWWCTSLQDTWCGMNIVKPPPPLHIQLFVDASTGWGLGLTLDGKWLAWQFISGWKADERDIGWAEMVAVELAVRTLVSAGYKNSHIIIHSDNKGVVGSMRAGRSRNAPSNAILRHIVALLQEHSLWITTEWVSTKLNPADAPSRGNFASRSLLFPFPPKIPHHLKPFVHPSISYHDSRVRS